MNIQHSKKVGRNELCPCGSGKKYKKCCLLNDQSSKLANKGQDSSNALSELKYRITDKPVDDNEVRKLPEEVQDKMEILYHKLYVNPRGCIKDLEDLANKYPHIPQFSNYLYASYAISGQTTKANNVMKENYKKNPTYLFALLNYAEYLINNGNFDKVADIFKNKFDLTLLYPERNVFHTTEVINFHGVIGLYYAFAGQTDKAEHCLNILRALSPKHGYTMKLNEQLNGNNKFF